MSPFSEFYTYEEFEKVLDTMPRTRRNEWILSLPEESLKIHNARGWSAAHELAVRHMLPPEKLTKELFVLAEDDGTTVGHCFCISKIPPEEYLDRQSLALRDGKGRSIAHVLADRGNLPDRFAADKRILLLKDRDNWTVAHDMALRFSPGATELSEAMLDPRVLNRRSKTSGISVAEVLIIRIADSFIKSPPGGNIGGNTDSEKVLREFLYNLPETAFFLLADSALNKEKKTTEGTAELRMKTIFRDILRIRETGCVQNSDLADEGESLPDILYSCGREE